MKVSARNQLAGMVKVLNVGVVNAEVVIALPGGMEIAAIISKSSCESLGLKVGSPACAVIKASDVMVGVCEPSSGPGSCGCQTPR